MINKILPRSNDPFFAKRYALQEQYLREIQESFKNERLWRIGLKDEDILGLKNLEFITNELEKYLEES
ncbi:MAG: ArsA-related P-loop ATPase [Wolinella sp.]